MRGESIHSNQGVENRYSAIERQFRDLRGRQLAVRIAKFDNGSILIRSETVGENAVVAGLANHVFGGLRLLQMNRLRIDHVLRFRGGFRIDDEFADIGLVTETLLNKLLLADADFLPIENISCLRTYMLVSGMRLTCSES